MQGDNENFINNEEIFSSQNDLNDLEALVEGMEEDMEEDDFEADSPEPSYDEPLTR